MVYLSCLSLKKAGNDVSSGRCNVPNVKDVRHFGMGEYAQMLNVLDMVKNGKDWQETV